MHTTGNSVLQEIGHYENEEDDEFIPLVLHEDRCASIPPPPPSNATRCRSAFTEQQCGGTGNEIILSNTEQHLRREALRANTEQRLRRRALRATNRQRFRKEHHFLLKIK